MSEFDTEQQKLLLKTVGKFVRDEIEKAVRPLVQRIAELETRGVEYKGTNAVVFTRVVIW
jgi:hypothetical protein